jgi:NAD+ synthase
LHSQTLAEEFDIPYRIIELDNAYNLLITQFESYIKFDGVKGRLLRANLKARLRMLTLYYSAQARNYLVLGTSNKSEMTIGYSTKYGDNAVDLQILGDLLKREVYELACYLKVPDVIIEKTPSGGLWSGQTDEEEMGVTYEELDTYLAFQKGEPEVIRRIDKMIKAGEHKNRVPPVAVIPGEYR